MQSINMAESEAYHDEFTSAENAPLRVANVAVKGRGVFATTTIRTGELIEEAPSWGFTAEEEKLINQTAAFAYYFVRNDRDIEAKRSTTNTRISRPMRTRTVSSTDEGGS